LNTLNFIATIIFTTASGALAPGPLFFATISHGAKSGAKSGLIFSVAHTLVEFTIVLLLAGGLITFSRYPGVKLAVGVSGGVVLILLGVLQIRDAIRFEFENVLPRSIDSRNLLVLGLAFTGLNPFFIVWWLTVGSNLILLSLEFASLAGVILMYICHVWMDYAWLTSVSHFAKMGTNFLGFKWYRIILLIFGAAIVFYGFTFIINSTGL